MTIWIGVTTHVDNGSEHDIYPNHPLQYVERTYLDTLLHFGMNPVLIPVTKDKEKLQEYLSSVNGLVLTGGGYVAKKPAPSLTLQNTGTERYQFEMEVLRQAIPRSIPILGICRGAQMINQYYGGSLSPLSDHFLPNHYKKEGSPPNNCLHDIEISPDSKLAEVLPFKKNTVNSFHRQHISTVGENLRPVAWNHTVIEAIEGTQHPWMVGVQFHPEHLWQQDNRWENLFQSLKEHADPLPQTK